MDIGLVVGVLSSTLALWIGGGRYRRVTIATLVVATATVTAHILTAEIRWQVVSMHLAGAIVAVAAVADLARETPRRRSLVSLLALVATIAGAAAVWSLPVTQISAPHGAYSVGRQAFTVVDDAREERWGPAPGGPRRIAVTVWYPAHAGYVGTPSPWIGDADDVIGAVAERLRLPEFTLGHLRTVTTAAADDAPVSADAPFPMVIFSHGWSGATFLHTDQLVELASHGYVVVGIDHTYAALASVLDDHVAVLDVTSLPADPDDDEFVAAGALISTFSADVERVFSAVTGQLAISDIIDPTRIALTGHSTGGGAAIMTCSRVRWCDAVVGADPWVEPLPDDLVGDGLDVPLLSIRSEEWTDTDNDARLRRLHAASRGSEGRISIAGSQHQDFTLVPAVVRAGEVLGMHGPNADDTHVLAVDWTRRFLDHHLRGIGTDPLDAPTADARVTVSRTPPDAP